MVSFDLTDGGAGDRRVARLGAAMARALAERGASVGCMPAAPPPAELAATIAGGCGVKTACFVADLEHLGRRRRSFPACSNASADSTFS